MPNWEQVLSEITRTSPTETENSFDVVRRKYLRQLSDHTGRNVIAYYSGFLSKPNVFGVQITDEDKNGFMLCCHEIDRSRGLDLILHTPGGDLYATDSLVHYLKQMFQGNIRAIVPQIAMSAGTMIACSCSSIVMGKHSNLGPTDPQINGLPAHAVQKQFNRAYNDIKRDPRVAPVWQPMLAQIGTSFLHQCDLAITFAEDWVVRALTENMLSGNPDVATKAPSIAKRLSDLSENKSHARHFHIEECESMGLAIEHLEDDPQLQDLVLTVHHCYMHILSNSTAFKAIENNAGQGIFKATAASAVS